MGLAYMISMIKNEGVNAKKRPCMNSAFDSSCTSQPASLNGSAKEPFTRFFSRVSKNDFFQLR